MKQKTKDTVLFLINLGMLITIFFIVEHYRNEVSYLKNRITVLEHKVFNK